MIRESWSEQPEIIVVEPDAAPSLAKSCDAGKLLTVTGPASNMGRLDCKTPSMLAFNILRDRADRFLAVSDTQAEAAVSVAHDPGYATTPSGVAGLAALVAEKVFPPRPLIILSEGSVPDA